MKNKPLLLTTKQFPNLEITKVTFTNYPEPCSVCNLHQCETDLPHTFHFTIASTIAKSIDEAFSKYFNKKPPDVS